MATMSSARSSVTRSRSFSGLASAPAADSRSTSASAASVTVAAPSGTTARSAVMSCPRFTRRRGSEPLLDERHEVHRALRHAHPRVVERLDLLGRRSRGAGNDRAGVPHPAPRRGGLAGDEADDRLGHLLLHEARGLLLVGAADLAHHRHGARIRVLLERLQAVDEVGAVDRVAADADAGRLADAGAGQLEDDLVSERARAADDAHRPRGADVPRDDADLRLARRDEPRAVRADEARALLADERVDAGHVQHRDALGDADDQLHAGVRRLHHRVGRTVRRDVDDAGVGAGGLHGVVHRVEHGDAALEALPALPRGHAGDDPGPVLQHLLGVERAVAARDPLDDDGGVLVDEDAHAPLPFASLSVGVAGEVASCTAFRTAESMSVIASNPFSLRMRSAISSFVPVRRITIGTLRGLIFVACTMPFATSSVRVMPPKMLNRIAFTLGSDVMIRSAATTFSGFDEPPMSRKLAGSPP